MIRSTPVQRALLGGVAMLASLAAAEPILAQAAPAPSVPPQSADGQSSRPDDASGALEDVVVTARRQTETLLNAPVTVTALTSAAIESRGIKSLADVAAYTPNMTLNNQGASRSDRSNQTIIIRGMTPQSSATTSVFIDGAPISSGKIEGIDDVERVEVLKGPQTATFGRQAFAGAVNVITKTPAQHLGGRIEALVGIYSTADVRASLEGPLAPDVLGFRVSARYYTTEGQYHNFGFRGTQGEVPRLGDQSTKSINGQLYFTPTTRLRVKLYGQYSEDLDGPAPTAHFVRSDYNCNAGAAPAGSLNYLCGRLPNFPVSRLAANTPFDPLFVSTVLQNSTGVLNPLFKDSLGLNHGGLKRRAAHAHLTIDYDVPGIGATISSLTAFNTDRFAVINDLDLTNTFGTPNPAFGAVPNTEPYFNYQLDNQELRKDYSEEVRLASSSTGWFRWLLGGNYVHTRLQDANGGLSPFGPINFLNGNPTVTDTLAAFGSLTFNVTHALTLSVEGRWQQDDIKSYTRGANSGPWKFVIGAKYRTFTPRAIVQYRVTSNAQVYASYAEGVNPGTFNANLLSFTPAQQAFLLQTYGAGVVVRPEKLRNYELGFKAKLWDGRAQIEAAVYHALWTDQIIQQTLPVTLAGGGSTLINASTNAGRTKLNGVEVETTLRPVEHLTINASGSVADSNIRQFACAVCTILTGTTNFAGNQLPAYSKYNAAAGLEYRAPFAGPFDGYVRADYIYKSGIWDTPANLVKTADTHSVNLRAGIEKSDFAVEAFVTNLLNNRTFTSVENNVDTQSPGFRDRVLNLGMATLRQGGVRVRYKF